MVDAARAGPRSRRPGSMTPEQIIQLIIKKVEEGDPEVLGQISLVMKNRVLQKKEDLKEIEKILKATTKPRE
ncbi:MAG TPA: hypothetical protein VMT31_01415 [Methanomicrobiales archaeon]|nr:hypothetical protein [Methanomicrobiales archaeon]